MDRRTALHDFVERTRNLSRREELDQTALAVLNGFEAAGVRSLLLKGPVLSRVLYTAEEYRSYLDIDVLVPPGDLAAAHETLTALGYRTGNENLGIDDVGGVAHSEIWAQRGTDWPLWVDLHHRLTGCTAPGDVVWAALWAGRSSIDFHGRETAIPGKSGIALHVAIHAAQHGPADTKAIADLARAVERCPLATWRSAASLAEKVGGVEELGAGLRLLPAGAGLAEQLSLPSSPQRDWEIRHREFRPRGMFHLQALSDAGGVRERMNVLRRSLLPTGAWIRSEFPWAARSRLLLLAAYACHITRAPLWALCAWVFRLRASRQGDG